MPTSTIYPRRFDCHEVCRLPWWRDERYDDDYSPAKSSRRRHSHGSTNLHSTNTYRRNRGHRVKVYVNIRYKHTGNYDTLLSNEVRIEIDSRCNVMDVWQAATDCNRRLRYYEPTRKVLATDSYHSNFAKISSEARVKDKYHKSARHWIFVVRLANNDGRKEKKKKRTSSGRLWRCI